jgi:hypothetical protein
LEIKGSLGQNKSPTVNKLVSNSCNQTAPTLASTNSFHNLNVNNVPNVQTVKNVQNVVPCDEAKESVCSDSKITQPNSLKMSKSVCFDDRERVCYQTQSLDSDEDDNSSITSLDSDPGEQYLTLDERNAFTAKLKTNKKIVVLIDSGSYYSLVSSEFVNKNLCLRTHNITELDKPIKLGVANGEYMMCYHSILFAFKVNQKVFDVNALIVQKPFGAIDVIFGQKDLSKHDICLNFAKSRLEFRKGRDTCLKLNYDVTLKPNSFKCVTLQGHVDDNLKNKSVVVKATGFGKQVLPTRSLVKFKGHRCNIPLMNHSDKVMKVKKGTRLANIDLRTSFSVFDTVRTSQSSGETSLKANVAFKAQPATEAHRSPAELAKLSKHDLATYNRERYPFLQDSDPKLHKTPQEIIEEEIDLTTDSLLPSQEHSDFKQSLSKHHNSLSLYGELGESKFTIDLKINQDSHRYIRPYYIAREQRPLIESEMNRLMKLGVVREGLTSFNSPVMLIARKSNKIQPKICLDVRYLNEHIPRSNHQYPLVEDVISSIGEKRSTVLSHVNLQEIIYSTQLSENSQRFTGISTFTGGRSYYFRKPVPGLSLPPKEVQNLMNRILSDIPNHRDFIVSYHDQVVIHSRTIQEHKLHIELLLNALQKHQLKVSPKQLLLFRRKVNLLGYVIQIVENKPCISIEHSRVESILNLKVPTNIYGARRFCGCVSYLSRFLPKLNELLKPIKKLTRKNNRFLWTELCQTNFDEIKNLITKAPVLSLPNDSGLFKLYIDTSRYATGMSIFQTEDKEGEGKENLIGYYSRVLPQACKAYSVTELEGFGLVLCLEAVKSLKSRFIKIFSDHSSLIQLKKSDGHIPTTRLKKIMTKLNEYHFELIYKKGRSLLIADFLSRGDYNNETDHIQDELPIQESETFAVTTRSKAKKEKERSNFDSENNYPHTTPHPTPSPHSPQIQIQPTDTQPDGFNDDDQNLQGGLQQNHFEQINEEPDLQPSYEETTTETTSNQEDSEEHISLDNYLDPQPLFNPSDKVKITVNQPITTQKELDQYISEVKRRSLRDFSVPFTRIQLSIAQQADPYFGDMFRYLNSETLPANKIKANKISKDCFKYALVNNILFRAIPVNLHKRKSRGKGTNHPEIKPEDFRLVICVPDSCLPHILHAHHDSLYGKHGGVKSTWNNLREFYFVPNLYDKIWEYIKSCDICQLRKTPQHNEETHDWIPRIFESFKPLEQLHADVKHMYMSNQGYKYILVLTDAVTRFTIAYPLKQVTALEVSEALLQGVCFKYGPFQTLYSDFGLEFCNKLVSYVTKAMGATQRFCTVGKHEGNLSERTIRSIGQAILSRITKKGLDWHLYLPSVTYAINTSQHSILKGYTPFELFYGWKPRNILGLTIDDMCNDVPIDLQGFAKAHQERIQEIGQDACDLQNKFQEKQRVLRAKKKKPLIPYVPGDLVYLLHPRGSDLHTNTLKFKINYVGPLQVLEIIGKRLLTLADLSGKRINGVFSLKRVKRCYFRTNDGTATNIKQIQDSIAKMDKIRRDNPTTVSFEPQSLFCLNNQQALVNPNPACLMTFGERERASPNCKINLEPYCYNLSQNSKAICREQTDEEGELERKLEEDSPKDGEDMMILRAKFRHGKLQFLLRCVESKQFCYWYDFKELKSCGAAGFTIQPVLGKDSTYTGRIRVINNKILQLSQTDSFASLDIPTIPVQGSLDKYSRNLFGKPSLNSKRSRVAVGKGSTVQRFGKASEATDNEQNDDLATIETRERENVDETREEEIIEETKF